MHIDEGLLARVIEAYECDSKTDAVDMALREMDRRVRYREFVKNGLGFTPEELGNAVEPGYHPDALRTVSYANPYKEPSSKVAETPQKYGS